MNDETRSDLEARLDALGELEIATASDIGSESLFIGRVRRRRRVLVAMRSAAGMAAVVVLAGVIEFGWREAPGHPMMEAAPQTPVYAAMDLPGLPVGQTGGPVPPIRAGIRMDDPMAIALLQ